MMEAKMMEENKAVGTWQKGKRVYYLLVTDFNNNFDGMSFRRGGGIRGLRR